MQGLGREGKIEFCFIKLLFDFQIDLMLHVPKFHLMCDEIGTFDGQRGRIKEKVNQLFIEDAFLLFEDVFKDFYGKL